MTSWAWTFAFLLVLVAPAPSLASELEGRIVGVVDGDTVDLLTAEKAVHRVRLSGIDAPEKRQPFGQVAKKALSDLVFDRQVVVTYNKNDRYGRIVGKVMLNGGDVNLQLVRLGLAWHFKKYEREQQKEDRAVYAAAEVSARARHVGLWSESDPTAPWDFRGIRHRQGSGV